MIARIRKAMNEKDEGFTLIELLVVIIIIGILAAIAIPVFLNQRKKAVAASIKADLKNAASQVEVYLTDNNAYPTAAQYGAIGDIKLSPGNTVTYELSGTGDTYCLQGSRAVGAQPATHDWVYESDNGGLQAGTVVACP